MKIVKRYILFLLGLYANSMGVALITIASLGNTPGSAIPYVLSLYFAPSQGQFSIAYNLFLVLAQIIMLGKQFQKIQYLQIAASFLFGYFVDFNLMLLSWLDPKTLLMESLVLVAGCVIQGLGVYLEVNSNVIMLPGEGFVKAAAAKTKMEFGITKVCTDAAITVISLVISLILYHRIRGVGAGTLVAAFMIGMVANWFTRLLAPVMARLLPVESVPEDGDVKEVLQEQIIITIGREYGCGAGKIGKLVAKKLGIPCYDDELADLAAEECGLSTDYILKYEERLTNSFLYDLYMQTYAYTSGEQSRVHAMYEAEKKVIQKITEKESCVIIGRLSNLVLENHINAFHVFLYAPEDCKVKRVMERESMSMEDACHKIKRIEQDRSNHYRQYAHKEWGRADSYDLTVNTGLYSDEKTADIIVNAMRDARIQL